jgi:hypothetical protein
MLSLRYIYITISIPEFVNECLHVLQLHLLTLNLLLVSLSSLNSYLLKNIVVSSIVVQLLIEEVDNLVASNVQKLSSMRYNNDCALACADIVLKPHDCV